MPYIIAVIIYSMEVVKVTT